MRIIVNNEAERQLVETFLESLHEEMLGNIQDLEWARMSDGIEPWISSDEYDFLENGIYHAKVEVSDIEKPMFIESWHIYGVCSLCGVDTNGTIDGEDIDLEDYQSMTSPEGIANWKCETCFFKEE